MAGQYGVTEKGFMKKNYNEILSDIQARARANFGEGITLDQNQVFGKLNDVVAWLAAELWELAEAVYYSISVETAEHIQLDSVVKYKGIKRKTSRIATGVIRIAGRAGTVVPTNFIVGQDNGVTYYTSEADRIGEDGYTYATVACNDSGIKGNAEKGQVHKIITPITGISAVMNEAAFVSGQDYETDEQLRDRYFKAVGGRSTLESIRGALGNTPGVTSVYCIENITTEIDENGLPPKSFMSIVHGGDDEDIGQTIFDYKPAGIQAYGETTVTVADSSGLKIPVGFTRASVVPVEVQVTLITNAYFPADGERGIKLALLKYIGGSDDRGNTYVGLGIHGNVIWSRLQAMLYTVEGITDAQIRIKKQNESAFLTGNIPVGLREIAQTDFENIEILFEL